MVHDNDLMIETCSIQFHDTQCMIVFCCMPCSLSCYDMDAFPGHDVLDDVVNHVVLTMKLITYNNLNELKDRRCAL